MENFRPDSNLVNSNEDIESLRFQLAEKVKSNLEKYKDEIKDFSMFTATAKNGNGFINTKDNLSYVKYNENDDSAYEVCGTSKDGAHTLSNIENPTYIYHNKMNWGSFYAPLGKCLHTPDRGGNMIGISMKGEKGKRFTQELTDSIYDLIKTIKKFDDLKEIAKEAIPVFEAFKETADRFPDPRKDFTAQKMIDEYNDLISKSNS